MSLGSPRQKVEELGCQAMEALDCVLRPPAPSGDIADVSTQNQKQNINHSKWYDIRKSGGGQSFWKVFKRQKVMKANRSSTVLKQSPVDNPSTWPDLER
ncbi:hypothetical protein Ancab_011575 [Ancistrocladus abbreviatus]